MKFPCRFKCVCLSRSHVHCISAQFAVQPLFLRCHLASISMQNSWKPEMIWKGTTPLSYKTLPEAGKWFLFL